MALHVEKISLPGFESQPTCAKRRLDMAAGRGLSVHEIEFKLGRDHRAKTGGREALSDAGESGARVVRAWSLPIRVGESHQALRGRPMRPEHRTERVQERRGQAVGVADFLRHPRHIGVLAEDIQRIGRMRQPLTARRQLVDFRHRQPFAADHAVHVRPDHLDEFSVSMFDEKCPDRVPNIGFHRAPA